MSSGRWSLTVYLYIASHWLASHSHYDRQNGVSLNASWDQVQERVVEKTGV